jgi:hypothetical protein
LETDSRDSPGKYHRLKVQPKTPRDELCSCAQVHVLVLCHALIANPIRCMVCNREIEPERLDLTVLQIDGIANWNMAVWQRVSALAGKQGITQDGATRLGADVHGRRLLSLQRLSGPCPRHKLLLAFICFHKPRQSTARWA